MSTPATPPSAPVPAPAESGRLRRRLRIAVACGLLLALAVFALPPAVTITLGQERIKGYAELLLSQALGRKVTVAGRVTLSALPWMSLRADDLVVEDAPGFGPDPFLTVARVTVDIRILPLFARTIMPGSITLASPVLRLKRDAADRSNWDGLPLFDAADRPGALLTGQGDGGAQRSEAPPGWQAAPAPSGVRIQDAMVHYEDRRRGFSGALRHLTLATGRGERFDFHLSFDVAGLDPSVEAQIHAKGTAVFDPERASLSVSGALVEATLSVPDDERFSPPQGGDPWRVALRASVDCDTATGAIAVHDLSAISPDAHLSGSADITGLPADMRATASLALRADLDGPVGQAAGFPAPGESRPREPQAEKAAPRDEKRSFLDFSRRFLASSEKTPLPGDLVFEAKLSVAPDRLSLEEATLRLRQAVATGRVEYLPGEHPRLTAALTAEGLDLDRLPLGFGGQGWTVPTAFLKNALGRISLDARSVTVAGVTLPRLAATLASENGQFRIYPVSAATPAGILAADVRGEVRGQALDITAEAEITETAAADKKDARARRPATLHVNGTLDGAGITGNLLVAAADPLSPARVLGLAAEASGAAAAPPEMSGKAVFSLTPGRDRPIERIEIRDMLAQIGPDAVSGALTIRPGPHPSMEVALHLDALEQDRLAALFAALSGNNAENGAPSARDGLLPSDLSGRISVGKATFSGVEAKNLTLEGSYRQGKAEVDSLGGDLFGGRLSGRIEAVTGNGAHRLTANLALAAADAAALTNKLLTGPCGLKLAAEGSGDSPQAMLASLSGRLEAEFNRDPKSGRKGEEPPFSRIKAGIDFKARPGRQDAGAPDAAPAYDLTASLTAQGASALREVKADATAAATVGPDGVQIGQGKLAGTAGIFLPGEHGGRTLPVSFGSGFSLDTATGAVAARSLTLEAAGTRGTGKIEKKGRSEGGKLSGAFDFPDINPRDVLPALGFSAPPQAAQEDLRHGALTFQVEEAGSGYEIKGVTLHLDDMRATGSVHLRNGFGRPKIDLDISHLDVDRYFPPKQPDPNRPRDAGQDDPIDLAALRSYDVEAKIRFGWLKKGNIVWKNGQTEISARGGLLSARHEAADFYGGRFMAEGKGDARDVVLKSSIDLQIDGFDAATLLKEWAEGDVLASGGATFVLAFKSNGLTERALRRGINGSARFQVTRGALKVRDSGSPPAASAQNSGEHQASQTPPAQATHKQGSEPKYELLHFSVLSSSYVVRDGMAVTNDFLIESKDMRVNGAGYVDLRDETIDLTVAATLESGAKVPATIRGPLEDPKLEIDRSKLLGDVVYRILKGIITLPGKALGRIFDIN
jgi:AsmA protein